MWFHCIIFPAGQHQHKVHASISEFPCKIICIHAGHGLPKRFYTIIIVSFQHLPGAARSPAYSSERYEEDADF